TPGRTLTADEVAVLGVPSSPDVSRLAAAGERAEPITGQHSAVLGLAFSPDGHTIAAGDERRRITLWDTRAPGKPGPTPTGHRGPVKAVAFSPDGHTLASAGFYDGTVRLWDQRRPTQPARVLNPHGVLGFAAVVRDVAFSPDGHLLAASREDGRVLLWDLRT